MAATVGLVALAAAGTASAAGGNVLVDWSIPNVPAAGLSNITFPVTVNPATLRTDGTYFAQQYNFTHAPEVGYTGLQPRADLNGHQRLHGVFSSFNPGTTSTDPNCHDGADGGAGVSCAAEFDAVYGHTYALTVARTGTDTWSGTATDTASGAAHHLGTYTLPAGSGNLAGSEVGFVEYYLGVADCTKLHGVDVVFGAPTSTDAGGLSGTSRADHEYSDCIGQGNYHATSTGTGTHITRGWVNAPSSPQPPPGSPAASPPGGARTTPTPGTTTRTTTPPKTTPSTSTPSSSTTSDPASASSGTEVTPSSTDGPAPGSGAALPPGQASVADNVSSSAIPVLVAIFAGIIAMLAGAGWYVGRRKSQEPAGRRGH